MVRHLICIEPVARAAVRESRSICFAAHRSQRLALLICTGEEWEADAGAVEQNMQLDAVIPQVLKWDFVFKLQKFRAVSQYLTGTKLPDLTETRKYEKIEGTSRKQVASMEDMIGGLCPQCGHTLRHPRGACELLLHVLRRAADKGTAGG